jgi:hypothetical protein
MPGALPALIVVPVLLALMLWTFAWPTARLEPRHLPLGVVGSADATRTIESRLNQDQDAFELHRYVDEQAARAAIEDREVYGAIIASPDEADPTVLTASAASPLVASMLESALAAPTAQPASGVEDVVPADSDDPRGSVLGSLVFPLVLGGVLTALIVSLRGRTARGQAGVIVAASALAGLVGVAMVQSWLGAFGGTWVVNASVLSLTLLAIASMVTGLGALLGRGGLVLGVLTIVLIGNPWSGVSSAPELLPTPIGLIGQLLPPGAGGNLLRSTAFFDDAGAAGPLTVLLSWTALGLAAMWAGALLRRRRAATSAHSLEPALQDAD